MLSFKQFLKENQSPEELAKKLQVSVDEINKLSAEELKTILKWVGEHDFVPDSKFDKKELEMGIKIEHEHTKNDIIAKLIAKDHLSEIPDYYSKLEKMENAAE